MSVPGQVRALQYGRRTFCLPSYCSRFRQQGRHRAQAPRPPQRRPQEVEAARRELAKGTGVLKAARLVGLGIGTVQRLKQRLPACDGS
jgi:hypothetical protein